jgi:hypothetical protein
MPSPEGESRGAGTLRTKEASAGKNQLPSSSDIENLSSNLLHLTVPPATDPFPVNYTSASLHQTPHFTCKPSTNRLQQKEVISTRDCPGV